MSSNVRMKGRTTEEAINSALEVLKATKEEVDIRVISEGEQGVLGMFGGKDAEVEVKLKTDIAEEAKNVLQDILDRAGHITQAYLQDDSAETTSLEIKADDPARVIGKDGATLAALQYLVSVIANKGREQRKRVEVDCGGYRKKQEKRIEKIARETAEEVEISGKEIELPPMTPRERRIIHMTIKSMPKMSSYSVGDRDNRRVIIAPTKS
ncbi:MAG: RNA-binding cell elongation regulator Jag/EloR [Candidatus Margulisiibacteriota bacterium]